MLSLILTALLGLFCYSGSIDNGLSKVSNDSNMIVNSNESFISNDYRSSPVSKNAFFDSDGEYDYFVYSSSDILSDYAFFSLSSFFASQYGDIESDSIIDSTNYYVSVRECYLGSAYDFDYAAGYPYHLDEKYQINNICMVRQDFRSTLGCWQFEFQFLTSTSSPAYNDTLYLTFLKPADFGWIMTSFIHYPSTSARLELYCIYGCVQDGNGAFAPMTYALKNVYDRNYNTDTYSLGYNAGYTQGESVGYQNGYSAGYTEGASTDATASTIFTGILDVSLIPVNVFLTIFNFEVFGVNIAGIVSGLLTLSIVIIIFRFLFGGKKDD